MFTNTLLAWQDITSRAQEDIGIGYAIAYEDIYEHFGILDVNDVTMEQMRDIEREIYELVDLMREILFHASTRIIDEPEAHPDVASA